MPVIARTDYSDQRLQPGAYVRQGARLAEVTRVAPGAVTLTDALTEQPFTLIPTVVLRSWKLVRAATAPDFPPQAAPSTSP